MTRRERVPEEPCIASSLRRPVAPSLPLLASLPVRWLTGENLKRIGARLGLERDWYLFLIAALVGLVMGVVAVLFIWPIQWVERHAEHMSAGAMLWLIPTMPAIGGLLVGLLLHYTGSGSGPGVTSVMFAIHRNRSRLPLMEGVRKWVGSTLTLTSGGSAGAEGPIVTIGAVIGSNIARLLRINPQNTATLLGCGAAGGMAAVFNAPIAGIFFVMEILLRDFSLRTFTPIVIASVIASATSQAILGSHDPIFQLSESLRTTLAQDEFTLLQIPNYLALGLVCATVAMLFMRGLATTEHAFERLRVHRIIKPALGGVMLGVIGLLFVRVTTGHPMPPFYGNGYPIITDQLLNPTFYQPQAATAGDGGAMAGAAAGVGGLGGGLLWYLLALGFLKAIGTSLTIGSGGSGGLFAPSLLLGAAVGGTMGYIVNALGWFPDWGGAANPATYALVGMAAMVAATTHAPLTGILIVYETTRSYQIILPLMLTAVIATIVCRLMYRESVYTGKLAALGVRLGAMSDLTILRRLAVRDVTLEPAVDVNIHESAQRLMDMAERYSVTDFVVTDDRGMYTGMVTAADLQAALVYREAIPLLQVQELARNDLPTVTRDEPLDLVLDKFARHDVQSLAVLEDTGEGAVLGLITRSRLMSKYQMALSEE